MDKIVKVPRFLYEIHGKNPTALDLWLTYAAGTIGGVVGVVLAYTSGIDLWKALLVGLLFFDIAGGVVANFTVSTRTYYGRSRRRRILFLCLHVLQPLLMALILGDYLLLMIFTAAFAVAGGLIINLLKTIKSRLSDSNNSYCNRSAGAIGCYTLGTGICICFFGAVLD